jgi:hypothetical protein
LTRAGNVFYSIVDRGLRRDFIFPGSLLALGAFIREDGAATVWTLA